jgi:hypothetical protein
MMNVEREPIELHVTIIEKNWRTLWRKKARLVLAIPDRPITKRDARNYVAKMVEEHDNVAVAIVGKGWIEHQAPNVAGEWHWVKLRC